MASSAMVVLIGHLGRDCEMKSMPDGTSIAKFSLATSRKRKSGEELTTWWNCSMIGRRADILAQYTQKGSLLQVIGQPTLRPYQSKDGQEKVSLDVDVSDFTFLDRKSDNSAANYQTAQRTTQSKSAPSTDQASWADEESDLPF